MIRGYVRVSTVGQADGNSIEAQTEQLRAKGAEIIYTDVMSGAKEHRPELDRLLSEVQPGDTVICCKLDRLSRASSAGYELVQGLLERNVIVDILNIGRMDSTPTGKLILQIFLAFAQYERDCITIRMQEGKAIARQKPGYHEGRPQKYGRKRLDHAMNLLEEFSYKEVERQTGISVSTLSREARRRRAEQSKAESDVQPS